MDAIGGQASDGGTVSAIVPDGSRVEAAFLYGSTFYGGSVTSVHLANGTDSLTASGFTALGETSGLQAYRTDITMFIRQALDDGGAAAFDFNVSDIVGSAVDGFALIVVYSNPDESTRTISLLDGFSATTGDDFSLTFSEPVNTAQTGFEALMSLGIGYGFQPAGQFSRITVDGRQLTTSAGGQDDGVASNGGLITIGGIGDSSANPDPAVTDGGGPRTDDELYDLAQGNSAVPAPFLENGATGLAITTINPSNNDNIFFAGFNITAIVAVDTDENDAPVAVNDAVSVAENATVSFGVLGNDFDPDTADTFAINNVNTAGLVGLLTDNGDGTFSYDPNGQFDALVASETATTSFAYTISDGELSSSATVTITITGVGGDEPPPPPPSDCPTVDRPGTQDGSASTDDSLTGPAYHNTFYFDNAAGGTGDDSITNFAKDDIIVVSEALRDSNNDGIITFGRNKLFDLGGGDTVKVDSGTTSLRFLGEACEGSFVYADAKVRPLKAKEGFVLSNDTLTGDAANSKTDIFFCDTALDLNLGADKIVNFGSSDILVTTTKLRDGNNDGRVNFGHNGLFDLPGGLGGPGDPGTAGEGGTLGISSTSAATVGVIEFDGSVMHGGVTYYVYSAVGSDIGVGALGF
ncbi:cadherin-like domain-containing protein [Sphingomonas sp. PB2P19]|uniref:Ig-like domain-containing protein n=1 Tax=Sphingomonas rhamnosi TaxID=3096156 RepID=UPI002FC5C7F1